MMTDLLASAEEFARWVHRHQKRKYTGVPYFSHCLEVSQIVRNHVDNPEWATSPTILAAALLHDCVEDQEVTPALLTSLFGKAVSDLVLEVTDVSRPTDGNRERRKEIDRFHLAKASPAGKTIKLADLISNTSSIVQHDEKFEVTYLHEKRLLLPFLIEGDSTLYEMASKLV